MTSVDSLAREVARLRREVSQIQKGQRVAHGATIEDSAVEVRDDSGSLRAIIGQQGDGTTAVLPVNGPPPPMPSSPIVTSALAALEVTWDGQHVDAVAPIDWMRVEVHVGPVADFTPDQGTLRATFESPQGGSVLVPLPYTEWFVKLRSRTTSGTAGPATASVAETPRRADTEDIAFGAVSADSLAVDALTGKTITGGEINGAVVTGGQLRTAASGQRITLNEGGQNKFILYDSAGVAIGEVSYRGLGLQGTSGAQIWLRAEATYPYLRFTNAALTNDAVINVVENTPGSANLGLNSGTFAGNGYTNMKWRTFLGEDFWTAERIRESQQSLIIGGRVDLRADAASFGYIDTSNATPDATIRCTPGVIMPRARVNIQPITGDSSSTLFAQSGPGQTGNLLSLYNSTASAYRMQVDLAGNTTIAGAINAGTANITGTLSAGNIATGTVTITPSAAHTPTSSLVNFQVTGSNVRAFVSAQTTVPGVRTPVGASGVTGVGASSITNNSMLVWVNRENTTATVVHWMVIGS